MRGMIRFLLALAALVVALCAWLFPFHPVGPSPFAAGANYSPTPSPTGQIVNTLLPRASAGGPEAPRQPSSANPSGSFSNGKAGYYVIGYTTDNQEVALHESQRQNQNGFRTHVAYTSNWPGFTPGWYIVVYGIYDDKADAVDALIQVEAQGVKAYIKHSGNRVR